MTASGRHLQRSDSVAVTQGELVIYRITIISTIREPPRLEVHSLTAASASNGISAIPIALILATPDERDDLLLIVGVGTILPAQPD